MKARFSLQGEAALFARFVASSRLPRKDRCHLKRFADVFRGAFPGETPLNHTGSTLWVGAWHARARVLWTPWIAKERLWAFARLGHWLFREGLIDDDAFAHVDVTRCLAGEELVLRYNLHRLVERYLAGLVGISAGRIRDARVVLLSFNTLLNRQLEEPCPPWGTLDVDAKTVFAWLRERSQRVTVSTLYDEASLLHRCLELGVREGAIAGNAIARLLQEFGGRGLRGIVEAALAEDGPAALASVRVEPRFASALTGDIQGLLDAKRALGFRLHIAEGLLAHLDRFLRQLPREEQRLSAEVIDRWLATTPTSGPAQRRTRWRWARQLCQHIREHDREAFVPDLPEPQRFPPPRPPHLFTPEEVRLLLDAAQRLPPVGSLRSRTYHALIALLYGAGLRVSEALGLDVGDFNGEQGLLLVRETKFYKSRWIPLAPSVTACLKDYVALRAEHERALAADTPIFVNRHGRRCAYSRACATFLGLLRQQGLRGPAGEAGPRIHDLRHSFAVRRLTRWYEEGADVQAKLPLLSTYLGHSSVLATEVYLTVTAELLRQAAQRFYAWRGSSSPQEVAHAC